MDIGIGTNGGSFTYGANACDYGVVLGGGTCEGEVAFGANPAPPDETGLSLGQVVSVQGTGTAEGWFCWDGACPAGSALPPLFNVNVIATYQFTSTNPGTLYPFTWTGAEFSSVPEPGTFVFASLGLAGVAAGRMAQKTPAVTRGKLAPRVAEGVIPRFYAARGR